MAPPTTHTLLASTSSSNTISKAASPLRPPLSPNLSLQAYPYGDDPQYEDLEAEFVQPELLGDDGQRR